jgi:hypothetical protein
VFIVPSGNVRFPGLVSFGQNGIKRGEIVVQFGGGLNRAWLELNLALLWQFNGFQGAKDAFFEYRVDRFHADEHTGWQLVGQSLRARS